MGVVMSAFSVSAVAGVPLGLLLAAEFSWRAPFVLLGGLSALVWFAARRVIPSMTAHLAGGEHLSLAGQFKAIFGVRSHWRAFALTIALTLSAFTVIPYIAAYWVGNVGLSERELASLYLAGGAATFFTARWIGRLADRYGKPRVLGILAACSLAPILAVTHAPRMELWQALLFSTPFFILVSGRFVPAMALLSSVPQPRLRGSFMSFNTCIQQLGMGLGAALAGTLIDRLEDGSLTGYGTVGFVSAALTITAIALSRTVTPWQEG
jgi:predicted MFS family arabinose efflux permease